VGWLRGCLGSTAVGRGVRRRTSGGIGRPQGEGDAGCRRSFAGGGPPGGRRPRCRGAAAPMRPAWGGHRGALWRRVAPSGGGGAGGSGPAGPGRREDTSGQPAGVATRRRSAGSLGQGRREVGRGRAWPARAGVGAAGADGVDSTTRSRGPCGSLGVPRAAGRGAYTPGRAGSSCSNNGSGSPGRGSRRSRPRSRPYGYWSGRCGGQSRPRELRPFSGPCPVGLP
jgi:hypothetical protein